MATSTPERLELLRRHDRSGFYASNQPATGQEPGGRVHVTVDPTNRVTGVQVAAMDEDLRTPTGLGAAVRAAYDDASVQRYLAGRDEPLQHRRSAPLPLPERPTRRPRMDDDPHRVPDLDLLRDRGHTPDRTLEGTGVSANECLRVTLLPASSAGRVEVLEPGWLTHASAGQVANAVTEAFTAAYEDRDA